MGHWEGLGWVALPNGTVVFVCPHYKGVLRYPFHRASLCGKTHQSLYGIVVQELREVRPKSRSLVFVVVFSCDCRRGFAPTLPSTCKTKFPVLNLEWPPKHPVVFWRP